MAKAKILLSVLALALAGCSAGNEAPLSGADAAIAAIEEMSETLRTVDDCGEAGFAATRNVERAPGILAGVTYISGDLTLDELDAIERAAREYVAITNNTDNICPDTDAVSLAAFNASMLLESITALRN
ncbi:hypothetical protein [Maricaulis maris]|uniref:hypothetical protein n=1 Tax=Maricaulis maris TaxID=74318 RepID=UPI003B8E8C0A